MCAKKLSKLTDIFIGADPELFAFDPGGVPVSVHDILPGSKWAPMKVPRGAIQVDGVAAEFNIDPAAKRTDFLRNISHVRNLLEGLLKSEAPDLMLKATPCANFPREYFDGLPEPVKALGCEPDFSAYTGKENPKPSTDKPFRTGSGHVHIGWTNDIDNPAKGEHFETCCGLTREYDFTLFQSSKIWDTDEQRRTLYGAPGAFRPKPYGLEYRVLSNAWVENAMLQMYVFDTAKAVAELFFKGVSIIENYTKTFGKDTIDNMKDYNDFLASNRVPVLSTYY